MPPRAVIPCLVGSGPVLFLPFVRDRTCVFGLAFVHWLRAEQLQLSRGVANLVVNTHLAHLLAFLLHVDDEAINDTARSAGLVVNCLDGRGDDLEVVVRLEGFVHLWLVPHLFE